MIYQIFVLHPAALAAIAPQGAEVLHRYTPSRLLVRTAANPTELPVEGWTEALPVHVHGRAVEVPSGQFLAGSGPRMLLRFAGPIATEWLDSLTRLGGKLHFFCPPFGLCASLSATALPSLRDAIPALLGAVPYEAETCTRAIPASTALNRLTGTPENWLDAVCFEQEDCGRLADSLIEQGIPVLARSRYKLRVAASAAPWLRDFIGVKLADPVRGCLLAQADLWAVMGHPGLPAGAGAGLDPALSGAGEIVAVADTGLDVGDLATLHPDFRGRVRSLQSWPINPSWSELVMEAGADDGPADRATGHGTHVAGLVLGNGAASDGRICGLAPGAELVFQAIEQYTVVRREQQQAIAPGYYLSGRPLDLRELFERARSEGARIHVNAWGDPAAGRYTDDSYEVDLFLSKNPDALVLFAAGNSGEDRDGDGKVDAGSLYAPASAKNAVAIGATEGPRSGVGLRGTWRQFDPDGRRFPLATVRNDPVSGEPERMAMFSSLGPTADGRIKPDLYAAGTNLVASRSQATSAQGWGVASPLPYYMYLGGTSAAVGVAGGAAAVLRSAWRHQLGTAPAGYALKALLVYGAAPILDRHGAAEDIHRCGFGRLLLQGLLPGQGDVPVLLEMAPGLATGEGFERSFLLDQTLFFRAVLAWYDLPGERLINDLDLCLLDSHDLPIWGNHPEGQRGRADRVNSVERIAVQLPPGRYRLRVDAFNVPAGRQAFALVCSDVPWQKSAPAWSEQLPLTALRGVGTVLAASFARDGLDTLATFSRRPWETLPPRLRQLDAKNGYWQALWNTLQHPCPTLAPGLDPDLPLTRLGTLPASLSTWLTPLLAGLDRACLARIRLGDLVS